ncbi:MAG: quercetin 2,3-dioxygenase [Betaproteobacteria bacterium RIFCSPLOWO2_12_FULL_62_58]|nr:MAG: quercetin 2,3-dioxygenase [Betaproteobacteria bacterium RIFCSPLOWO2_12_FULL_62_58]
MLKLRSSQDRGHANHGWLDTWHTFSFADYHDPDEMGFGALRVINDDRVQPGRGFGMHGHRDMEIITYILDGALEHKDSMGNGSVIRRGDVQRMSAGKGVLHSEFNPSPTDPVHLLQIWIEPNVTGIRPSYEEKRFAAEQRQERLRLVASPDGRDSSVMIHQDTCVYATLLDAGDAVTHQLAPGRKAYVHVARGAVEVNGERLTGGDGAKIGAESKITFAKAEGAEILLFDLA